jgi:hypothetical protein
MKKKVHHKSTPKQLPNQGQPEMRELVKFLGYVYERDWGLIEKFRSLEPTDQVDYLSELCLIVDTIIADDEDCGFLNVKARLRFAREFEGWAAKLKRPFPVRSKAKPKSVCRILASDRDLEKIMRWGEWNVQTRRSLAKTLMNWAQELLCTADLMDGKSILANLN